MIEKSEKSILTGECEVWEIKPILERTEYLRTILVSKSGGASVISHGSIIDKNISTKQRAELIDETVFEQIVDTQFNFAKGNRYKCLKCFAVFTSIEETKKHVVTKELGYYNSLVN